MKIQDMHQICILQHFISQILWTPATSEIKTFRMQNCQALSQQIHLQYGSCTYGLGIVSEEGWEDYKNRGTVSFCETVS